VGDLDELKKIVESGGLDVQNKDGKTALMFAVENEKWEIAEFLIKESGANVNLRDNSGNTFN
jgi:ankyrin repeat protein